MELKPGMFVEHGATVSWEADPEVPGSSMVQLIAEGPVQAGLTRIDDAPEPMTWTPEHREVFAVLAGSVRIVFADGDEVTLGVGDIGTIPAGLTTTWHVSTPFREMWVLVEG